MNYKTCFLTLMLPLLFSSLLYAQTDTLLAYYGNDRSEQGRNIVTDAEGYIYFLSDVETGADFTVTTLRKVDPQGAIIYEMPLATQLPNLSRDILLTADGNLLCVYEVDPNPPNKRSLPLQLQLHKLDLDGNTISKTNIPLNNVLVPDAHVLELSDGTLAMVSPKPFVTNYVQDNSPYVTHLTAAGDSIATVKIDSMSITRLRGVGLAENDHVLLSGLSLLVKVDINTMSKVWRKNIVIDGARYTRSYQPVLLEDQQSYGWVLTILGTDSTSEVSGIYYFQLDLDGNTLVQAQYPEGVNTASFPNLVKGRSDQLFIVYAHQLTETAPLDLKFLCINSSGDVLEDQLFVPGPYSVQPRGSALLNDMSIVSTGSAFPIDSGALAQSFLITIPFTVKTTAVGPELSKPEKNAFVVYPNPVQERICSLRFTRDLPGDVVISLTNAQGKLIRNWYRTGIWAGVPVTISLGDIANGTYFVTVHDRQFWSVEKVIVNR